MYAPVRSLPKQLKALFVNENQANEDTVATNEGFLGATKILNQFLLGPDVLNFIDPFTLGITLI